MVAALWANPNWDDKGNDRPGRIKEITKHFNKTIELIYHPEDQDEYEPDWDNPFWQAHLREMSKTRARLGLVAPEGTVKDVLALEEGQQAKLLELERRAQRRDSLDQPMR